MTEVAHAHDDLASEGGRPVRAKFLPFCQPCLGTEEEQAVVETLRSGWLTKGPRTIELEQAFARVCGASHAVCLNSGTAALHLALIAARVGAGDEVITTPITFAATANVIVHVGATPVFVDVEPDTLNIDPQAVARAITPRTKAIIPVHFAGHPCNMTEMLALAARHRLTIIEDAAHALGAEYRGRPIGSLGPYTCFSLYATKNLTTGEGGFVTTNDAAAAEEIGGLALHGLSTNAWQRYGTAGYKHASVFTPGFNYVMFDLQAALGLCQLRKMEEFWQRRRALFEAYDAALGTIDELWPLHRHPYVKHAYHLYVIRLRSDCLSVDRDQILNAIQAEGIGLGVHFRALHLHPYYQHTFPQYAGRLPNAETASEQVLSLPLYPQLSAADVGTVVSAVKKVIGRYRRR
ncbi:MAG TPA: DegT/DnrJ/EryC1/StrS aminotransferase family protein [Candidatus Binatia bacterium]|nr:DegT/DnrJ/EryC1/StrS aminotransferase family protein [Candidatus Binatia bacterium]